jgi:hypothetical protein
MHFNIYYQITIFSTLEKEALNEMGREVERRTANAPNRCSLSSSSLTLAASWNVNLGTMTGLILPSFWKSAHTAWNRLAGDAGYFPQFIVLPDRHLLLQTQFHRSCLNFQKIANQHQGDHQHHQSDAVNGQREGVIQFAYAHQCPAGKLCYNANCRHTQHNNDQRLGIDILEQLVKLIDCADN